MMINKTKTKILTLSVASALGLAAITVLASNANNLLDFQGGVKQNAHLELNELKLIENPANPGASSSTDIVWNMNGGALEVTTQENYSTNNSLGKLSRNKRRPGFRRPGGLGFIQSIKRGLSNRVEGEGTLSIGGKENTISAFDSFILGGSGNTLYADTSIIGASNEVRGGDGGGNIVLSSSSGANFSGSNNIILSSSGISVYGTGNIVISASSGTIRASSGSMAIGHEVIIHHDGTFVFNGKPGTKAYSSKEYTTLISAQNGMIINTNAKKAHNVGLTINGGLKVGRTTDLDQQGSLIVQDDCLQLKSTINGGIGFYCLTKNNKKAITPKCGQNAQEFPTSATAWLGQRQIDFCQKGDVDRFPAFFTEAEPLTRIWRCTAPGGNSVVCQATQQVKVPKPTTCPSGQHLEGGSCVPNTKTVLCDDKGINKANGSIANPNVTITWSNGVWSSPEKCQLTCNTGYEAKEDSTSHKLYCAKKEVIKNKICKGKKTTQSQRCVVTNKEDFKRKINQNVGYYPFLNNRTMRLKRGWHSFGYGGIDDPEGNTHEMPSFVRYGSPTSMSIYDKIFVPSSIIEGTNSYFKYYAGKNGPHSSSVSSPEIHSTDDLYLELKYREDGSTPQILRDKLWKKQQSRYPVFKPAGGTDPIRLYAKLDRGASGEFSDGSLDNFCYYNKKGQNCLSRAWALECETADKIIEQNCRQYTNENACRNNRKCERGEE